MLNGLKSRITLYSLDRLNFRMIHYYEMGREGLKEIMLTKKKNDFFLMLYTSLLLFWFLVFLFYFSRQGFSM